MGNVSHADFQPPWWLRSAHLQTIWGPLKRRLPEVQRDTERFPLADGDHLLLDWAGPAARPGDIQVLLLHGLSGCSDSHYMRGLQATFSDAGIRSVAVNSRGAKSPNDTALCYHAGEIDDLNSVIEHLYRRDPSTTLVAIGVSLGGSRLLNWLAKADSGKLAAVASVCAPLRLDLCADRLDHGLSQIYRGHLLKQLLASIEKKKVHLREVNPAEAQRLEQLSLREIESFWDYDEKVIAPLYGFRSAGHYYQQCSAGPQLQHIRTPTLVLHAEDDPFMTPAVLPPPTSLSPAVQLELSRFGGHVGFIASGPQPFWLEQRMLRFVLAARSAQSLPNNSGNKDSVA